MTMGKKNLVTVIIDNNEIKVAEGSPLINAAQSLGIKIPTLCFHEALPPSGSCRICIVELQIKGNEGTWMDAACVYPARDGLIVQTNSPKVRRERKIILEMLLSKAPQSPILLELAEEYGADKNRFLSLDKGESNCILCSLCVRVCHELIKSDSIGTAHRGVKRQIVSPFQIAKNQCIGCEACINICPTGAIVAKLDKERFTIKEWGVELEMKTCETCGKSFAPTVYWQKLQSLISIKDEIYKICPECRRKKNKIGFLYSPLP